MLQAFSFHTITQRDPMDEREALIQTIIDNPDDDVPRLVYADWQEEHGQIAHAELIRVQCALAVRPTSKDYNRSKLRDREKKLFKSPEFRDGLRKTIAYKRGFIPYLLLDGWESERLLEQGDIARLQLDRVLTFGIMIRHHYRRPPKPDWVNRFLEYPWLHRIEYLLFESNYLQASDFQSLSTSPHFFRVKRIHFDYSEIPIETFADLLLSPSFRSLKGIDLTMFFALGDEKPNRITQVDNTYVNEMIQRVAQSPQIRNWTRFIINAPGVGETGMTAILESPYLDNIEELGFEQASISSPLMQRLRARFGERIRLPENIA
jgi:uncharacterized protein (TIGR02996 family)